MNKLEKMKTGDGVNFNVKIPAEIDYKLRVFREAARLESSKFNVSDRVIAFLDRMIAKVEKDCVFDEKTLKKAEKIVKEKKKNKEKNKEIIKEKNK